MQTFTISQVIFALFLLNTFLKIAGYDYKTVYVEPECQKQNTIVFHLGVPSKVTSFIMRSRKSYGYGAENDCNITVSASYIRNGHVTLTVRKIDFENPNSCRDYLQIFNGTTFMKKLCGNVHHEKSGTSFTLPRADFMKFHYYTTSNSNHSGFEIIATTYTDGPCKGRFNFHCHNHNCISNSLICDNYNNCGDDSDETNDNPARCSLGGGVVAAIVIGVLLLIALVSTTIWCFQTKRNVVKIIKTASVENPTVQQTYQQSPDGIENPTYGVVPSQSLSYKQ